MGKIFRIFTLFGVPVGVHWSFMLLVVYFAATRGLDGLHILWIVFGSVLLHEFGHILMARRYGIGCSGVILLPIGGIAALEDMPKKHEFMVTLAGPLVNVALAIVGWALGFKLLMMLNIVLGIFNLLPVFPMDGGRLLRSALGWFMSWPTATLVAARIGQAGSIALGLLFLYLGNWIAVFVFGFVFWMAQKELGHARA